MASKLKKVRNITESLKVTGHLNEDGQAIVFQNEDGNDEEITIEDCIKHFVDKEVSFSISLKYEEDLDENTEG